MASSAQRARTSQAPGRAAGRAAVPKKAAEGAAPPRRVPSSAGPERRTRTRPRAAADGVEHVQRAVTEGAPAHAEGRTGPACRAGPAVAGAAQRARARQVHGGAARRDGIPEGPAHAPGVPRRIPHGA